MTFGFRVRFQPHLLAQQRHSYALQLTACYDRKRVDSALLEDKRPPSRLTGNHCALASLHAVTTARRRPL